MGDKIERCKERAIYRGSQALTEQRDKVLHALNMYKIMQKQL